MRTSIFRTGALILATLVFAIGCGFFAIDGSLVVTVPNLPDGVTAITVTVAGDDMETVSGTFTGDPADGEPLLIPEGTNRRWTVVVDVDNATPVTQYTAEGTADIVAGEVTVVEALLYVSGSAVIALDDWNERLVMLDGPNGDEENLEFHADFVNLLHDAEIGPDGFIYVLYDDNANELVLERMTSFADLTRDSLLGANFYWGVAIAIDNPNRILYYNDGTRLRSRPLGGTAETVHTPDLGVESEVFGLSTDNSGNVYIVYTDYNDLIVAKFDPDPSGGSGTIVADAVISGAIPFGGLGGVRFDVLWKAGRVFVADSSTNTIVVLPDDLSSQTSIGSAYASAGDFPVADGEFVGPVRFAGHGNPKVYVLDDDSSGFGFDAVTEFSGESLAAWVRTETPDIAATSKFDFWEFPQ